MDHMHWVKKTCSNLWKYPDIPDICYVEASQILPIKPCGHWDFTNFKLDNADLINKKLLIERSNSP